MKNKYCKEYGSQGCIQEDESIDEYEEIVNEFFVKMVGLEHKRSLHSNRQIFEGFTDRLRKEARQEVAKEILGRLTLFDQGQLEERITLSAFLNFFKKEYDIKN